MVSGRVSDAAAAMAGRLLSEHTEALWEGAALDSRAIVGGELFFALEGERTDGHRFVSQALERGASAAVVSHQVEAAAGRLLIEVEDTFVALHELTRDVRSRVPEHLVAVTGSVGKTTTKEILATLLAQSFRVARNPGSLNNLYGFPIALLGIPEDTQWMVAEMGMSTPGELGRVSMLGLPDVAIFTNVRPAHLEAFGSLRAIAEAKAELLQGLNPGGIVVANRDDAEVVRIVGRHQGEVIWFALKSEADYSATDVRQRPEGTGTEFRLITGSEEQQIELPLHGLYNVENFLAAAACAHRLGVSLAAIAEAAKHIEGQPMRGVLHRLADDRVVIDDCYNSNPTALGEALRSARELAGRRYWAVLGDMLELGETAPDLHRQVGRLAAELGFSPVVGVGEQARELTTAAAEAGAETEWYESASAAADRLAVPLLAGDVLLVKGSRGVGLEAVVDSLLASVGGDD